MKKACLISILFLVSLESFSQNAVNLNQFYFNPSLYNPAYTGSSGFSELFLFHRQQWAGIEDAPRFSGLNFQYPTRKNMAFGLLLGVNEVVGVENINVELAWNYTLRLHDNHSFSFAIAGGINTNSISSDLLESGDPALANLVDNSMSAVGRFGIVYGYKNLNIGFSLPSILENEQFTSENFNSPEFSSLDNRVYSIDYFHHIGISKFAIKPYVVYQDLEVLDSQFEGGNIFYYNNKVWLGGAYNSETGGTGFFGLSLLDKIDASYSYEFGNNDLARSSNGTHEVHISLRFGKNKLKKLVEEDSEDASEDNNDRFYADNVPEEDELMEETELENSPSVNTANNQTEDRSASRPSENKQNESSTLNENRKTDTGTDLEQKTVTKPVENGVKSGMPDRESEEEEVPAPNNTGLTDRSFTSRNNAEVEANASNNSTDTNAGGHPSLTKGNYVVIGVFRVLENSRKMMTISERLGHPASYAMNPEDGMFYVYIHNNENPKKAKRYKDVMENEGTFQGIWVKTVQ